MFGATVMYLRNRFGKCEVKTIFTVNTTTYRLWGSYGRRDFAKAESRKTEKEMEERVAEGKVGE